MSQYHVYSLPVELLDILTPRNAVNESQLSKPTSPEPPEIATSSGPRTCNICQGATFLALDDQRAHFRSDWHRYNVKTRLAGGKPVTESAFTQLVDALEDSLSGSESSSDEGDSSESDAVTNLVNKAKQQTRSSTPDEERTPNAPQTALTWFHSPPSTQIGVYKALYSNPKNASNYLDELREMQHSPEGGRTWAMFMVAGGHFAGAIVRVSRQSEDEDVAGKSSKKPLNKPRADTEVLFHKTFHRYTTRRKQGGSQSLNDNAKGNAKSAGALLRRYGEQSLRDDIRNLLLEWREEIDACERIWIRANGSNRKIFVGYDDAVILKGDDRLRTFPFPTRRPTQSELARCLLELTRVKVTHFTEEALREQDEAYLQFLPKPKPVPTVPAPEPEKPKPIKLTKEEELLREKWNRLLEMVTKGRLEPLKAFWDREGPNIGSIDARIPEWTGERRATLLQVATQAGHEDLILWLLEEVRANPTIPVSNPKSDDPDDPDDGDNRSDASDAPKTLTKGSRRTAYDLARSKGVRDVFRRCAAAHPDWWDWLGAGRVPSVLSQQMEQVQEEKKKERRKGLKDKVREREAREREKEKEQPPSPPVQEVPKSSMPQSNSMSNRLGGSTGAGEGVAGLTAEMRAKVERERRARAAEARMKALASR
ncbi:Zinc finger protein [Termitomyces sp. T112]|nr:Zinc finger protein [Termitomyces sp. T112]